MTPRMWWRHTHRPFTWDGFVLCDKCGEALDGVTHAPLGRLSTVITTHYGASWRKRLRRVKRERGALGAIHRIERRWFGEHQ